MAHIWFLILSMVLIFKCFAIRVQVTYNTNANDLLRFSTADKSICSKYNALYVRTSFGEVICQCSYNQIFFGIDGQSPKCRDENFGRLYGE